MEVYLEFKPQDCWWGLYTERREYLMPGVPSGLPGSTHWRRHIWICVVPMFPLHIIVESARFPTEG